MTPSARVSQILLLGVAFAFSLPAHARTHHAKRTPAAAESAPSSPQLCFTKAQYQRFSKFPVKADCLTAQAPESFCAKAECIGEILADDFDGDGKLDQAFTLRMSDKDTGGDEYWGVFAYASSYKVYLRVPTKIRSNTPAKGLIQLTARPPNHPEFAGSLVTLAQGESNESYGFDTKTRSFRQLEISDADSDPQKNYPGIGLSLMVGANLNSISAPPPKFTVSSGATSTVTPTFASALGYEFGARIDGYVTRFLSFETGLLYATQSYTINASGGITSGLTTVLIDGGLTATVPSLQVPVQLKFWPVPLFSIGGGIVYTTLTGNIGCSANGSFTCTAASISPADAGLKPSYISWIVTLAGKYRFEDSDFSAFADLSLMGTPNLVQDAAKVGASSASFTDIMVLAGVRYGLFSH